MYSILFNLINKLKLLIHLLILKYNPIPYQSIKYIDHDKVIDITWYYYFLYIGAFCFNRLNDTKLYQIHIKKSDKIYIIDTTMITLINYYDQENNDIVFPRSLLIKYSIKINNEFLDINDKIYYKKYCQDSRLIDVFKFNSINLEEIVIYKNNVELYKYQDNINTIYMRDIYIYLC